MSLTGAPGASDTAALDRPATAAPALVAERAVLSDSLGVTAQPFDLVLPAQSARLEGDWEPIVDVVLGRRTLRSGTLRIAGVPAADALAAGVLGLAPPVLPIAAPWTVERALEEAARLRPGLPRRRVRDTLARLQLETAARRKLLHATATLHRATAIASALLSDPEVLWVIGPLGWLPEAELEWLGELLVRESELRTVWVAASDESLRDGLASWGPAWRLLPTGTVTRSASPGRAAVPLGRRFRVELLDDPAPFLGRLAELIGAVVPPAGSPLGSDEPAADPGSLGGDAVGDDASATAPATLAAQTPTTTAAASPTAPGSQGAPAPIERRTRVVVETEGGTELILRAVTETSARLLALEPLD